jgi:hypothetical protein
MNIVYNKSQKKYLLFSGFSEENGQCLPFFMNNEYMYTIISPADGLPVFSEEILNKENKKKLERTQPDDNCIIIRYKFK